MSIGDNPASPAEFLVNTLERVDLTCFQDVKGLKIFDKLERGLCDSSGLHGPGAANAATDRENASATRGNAPSALGDCSANRRDAVVTAEHTAFHSLIGAATLGDGSVARF